MSILRINNKAIRAQQQSMLICLLAYIKPTINCFTILKLIKFKLLYVFYMNNISLKMLKHFIFKNITNKHSLYVSQISHRSA